MITCDRWGTPSVTTDDPACRCVGCLARRWDRLPPTDPGREHRRLELNRAVRDAYR